MARSRTPERFKSESLVISIPAPLLKAIRLQSVAADYNQISHFVVDSIQKAYPEIFKEITSSDLEEERFLKDWIC